jgi:drug/metabolite transporter (DMT)-like permease
MRPGTVLGALLILAGVIALSVGGFSFTTREKVAERLSLLLGGIAIAAGVVLIVASSRKSR